MDVKCVNPLMRAVKNVFKVMLNLDVQFGQPCAKDQEQTGYEVSAVIGLSGDVTGSVVVGFPRSSALKIAGIFAGIVLSDADEDFTDAVGELANMIAGNARKDIEGVHIAMTTPTVVVGGGHRIRTIRLIPKVAIPCACSAGSFIVEVGMTRISQSEEMMVAAGAETSYENYAGR